MAKKNASRCNSTGCKLCCMRSADRTGFPSQKGGSFLVFELETFKPSTGNLWFCVL